MCGEGVAELLFRTEREKGVVPIWGLNHQSTGNQVREDEEEVQEGREGDDGLDHHQGSQ